jgi:TusA-related sulfurtransferase
MCTGCDSIFRLLNPERRDLALTLPIGSTIKGKLCVKRNADHILDLRGAIPPISLLKVTQTFREMKPDQILEILGHDPDTRRDLFKVLPAFSYELIIIEEMERDASFRVQMKKK